ncbi:membrane-bound inhibitor of C-type lysozyme [Devosia subaequoris]|uniref:Membrane-bound inhibitor of C-type lysozyme n=1 Tax=Devosia subaequoris TaxID=395930 RepID=A0A7W6IL73_9HYPH|nr:MliC family protein [Devosia subaequoris]MBB4051675.1 membrane-bound inhibitor of C-type lysozyme [Devosia subaequoris]MCP1209262.1 MliC family protein [Devosia subaequoris]
MLSPKALLAAGFSFLAPLAAVAQGDVTTLATVPTTPAASAALTLTLESVSNIERRTISYLCDDDSALSVQYINAAPNFLAIVPVDGQSLVFATTLSASGARYVSGPYEWWSHQDEATLRDLMQDEDAAPLATCTEASNTP